MSCHHSILVSELKVLNPKSACSNYPQIESVHRRDFVRYTLLPMLVYFFGKSGVVPITNLMLNNLKNVKAWAPLP